MKRSASGVTLIELMVATAIVALLAAMAWPGYAAITQRAHRTDARLALLRIQHLQERHYTAHLRYAARLGENPDAQTLAAATRSDSGHYELGVEASEDGQRYLALARAAAQGPQARDQECQQFSVDQAGRRRSADSGGTWQAADATRCWQ